LGKASEKNRKSMKKEKILIALLTFNDSVSVSFLNWIDDLKLLNNDPNHPRLYDVLYVPGLRPVAYARNIAATNFIKNSDADKIWFIDDDLVPTDSSIKIFDSNADIVSGLYYLLFIENGTPIINSCIYTKKPGGFSHINPKDRMIGQDIIPIDSAGTGSLLIDRKVFSEMMLNSFEYTSADGDPAILDNGVLPFFRTMYKADASEERSEDIDFVWRAKQLGYKCECVLDARFFHKKKMLIDWFI